MILQTERLLLREMNEADLPDLAEMLQNPAVMYAYEHDFSDRDVQAWLDRQTTRYRTCGFGLWAVLRKDTMEMIGQAGLTMQPYKNTEVLEIGYLLKETHWHRGYATEAARGCKAYAFETLHANAVHSIIKTDNFASIRVAERLGMRREDTFTTRYYHGDMQHYLYALHRPPL